MTISNPKALLAYPPLDGSIVPPLATAILVASVKAQIGKHAAVGIDLNYHFQRALLNNGNRDNSSCCDQSRMKVLTAFCEQNGWEMSEEKLLLADEIQLTGAIPLNDLYLNFMGSFLSETMRNQLDEGYSLVGISVCYPSQLLPALLLANVIRESIYGPLIVLGGPYVAQHAERLNELGWLNKIDFIVRGPGETVLPQLTIDSAASNSRPAKTILVDTGISLLPNQPTPDFTDLAPADRGWPKPILPYLSSVGCSWGQCTFCRGLHPDTYVPPLPDRLSHDISSFVASYDAGGICFSDEALDLSVTAEAFLASGLYKQQIGWVAEARLDKTNQKIDPALLYASGCHYLLFGLETGSERLLRAMKKGITISTAEDVVRRYAASGILVHLFLMVGFPGETEEDVGLTLKFLERNEPWIASASVSCFRPWPETAVWQQPDRYGIVFEKTSIREALENQIDFKIRDGSGPEIAQNRRIDILNQPVMQRICSRLTISHRACATLGNKCSVLSRMDGFRP